MTNPSVVITTSYLEPNDETHRLLVEAGCHVAYARPQDRAESGESLTTAIGAAQAIIAGTDPFTSAVIEAATDLKIIARTGAGYDNVDLGAAARRGVTVCNTPGANRQSVSELTLGLMMSCARGLIPAAESVKAGLWTQTSGQELSGATLGIIGLGSIGKELAKVAIALGMEVVAHDPKIDLEFADRVGILARDLPGLLAAADFVTLHLALSSQTHHLIGREELAKMKPGAILINTSRGGVVDEQALGDALRNGHLGGAALDVLEQEPLAAGDPLRDTPNLVITPHIAGATVQARSRSGRLATEQVIDCLNNRPVTHPVHLPAASPTVKA